MSIITPTYEHGAYVVECLSSALAQTVGDWELILVDDGSTDETVPRARSVTDERFRIVTREHTGIERLADTYNAALALCRGTYVGVLEGDDRWRSTKIAVQLPVLRDPSVVLTFARYATIGAHGNVLAEPVLPAPAPRRPFDALPALLLDSFIEMGTTMIRRDALEAIGGFRQHPGHRHVDHATFLALAERGSFVGTEDLVYEWRRHAGSFTVQATTAAWNFEGPRLCMRHALDVRRRHRERTDLPSEHAIVTSWSKVLARRYWHAGRVLQARRQWGHARRLFIAGWKIGAASMRQRALLGAGIVASVLRIDLERLGGAFGARTSLSDL